MERGFDTHAETRREYGSTEDFHLFAESEHPNDTVVLGEWDSAGHFQRFTEESDVKKTMGEVGVVGDPEVGIFDLLQAPTPPKLPACRPGPRRRNRTWTDGALPRCPERGSMWRRLVNAVRGGRSESRVGLFVDGPNVLREEFDVDLDDVRVAATAAGRLAVTRLYLDENAPSGLIKAAEAHGYEVVVTSGDVDVKLAVDAAEIAVSGDIDTLAVASRDTDFKPVLELAARRGVRTLAIAPGTHGRSDALQSAAHDAVTLGE